MRSVNGRRVFAAAALLTLAFGVLGMHVAADRGATAHAEQSSRECHHDGCAPTPVSNHVGVLCVVAAAVAIAIAAVAVLRRSSTLPVAAAPSRWLTGADLAQRLSGRRFTELCVLRC